MTVAVVPIKDLGRAKERLASTLSASERQTLVLTMLEDVLGALSRTPALSTILVVTRAPEAITVARAFGAEALVEHENHGYTEAVDLAVSHLEARRAPSMLVVPGDVPALTAGEVTSMLDALGPSPAMVLAPSRNEKGTNGALLSPPRALTLRFGEPSFLPHVRRARDQGLSLETLRLPGLSLDLDTPEDLALFMQTPSATRTYAFLRALGKR